MDVLIPISVNWTFR